MSDPELLKADSQIEPSAATPQPTLDTKRQLVAQVLGSRTFAKSVRLSQFFEFICSKALDGHTEEINEQKIGIHVFGRSPAYNSTDDSIVRSQARLLRQRLEEYFEHECPACPLIILIPKGGYVPVFEPRPFRISSQPSVANAHTASPSTPLEVGQQIKGAVPINPSGPITDELPIRGPNGRPMMPGTRLVALLGFIAVCVAGTAFWLVTDSAKSLPSMQLWQSVFASGRSVVIVPSDDGLVLSEEMQQAPISLDDYLSGDYLRHDGTSRSIATFSPSPHAVEMTGPLTSDWLSSHQYTSTADLELAMRLSRLPQAAKADLQPRYARVLRLDDLKSSNVILIGGVGANPWVGLYAPRLNFDVNYDWKAKQGYVWNKSPKPGEQARYLENHAGGTNSSYGVLAYLPGITGNGSALLFEGSGMAGTEAAADFPFNLKSFAAFIRKIRPNSTAPLPYFEVLLETRSLGGNAPEAHVLAWRVVQP